MCHSSSIGMKSSSSRLHVVDEPIVQHVQDACTGQGRCGDELHASYGVSSSSSRQHVVDEPAVQHVRDACGRAGAQNLRLPALQLVNVELPGMAVYCFSAV